ncbi:MAG: nitroreductase family protein [Planctomycetaceae bacterium]
MSPPRFLPLPPRHDPHLPPEDAARRFFETMRSRRSVRMFSDRPVSRATIAWIVRAAASAPSGANKQPWRFVAVQDRALKRALRIAAEEEERAFYGRRASRRWLRDLEPLGTDPEKPFLEVAPWLLAVFRLARDDAGGQVYYGVESVGIAAGFLLAAVHHAGLVALTHTPSPMKFLNAILKRPERERPFLLVPIGYPAEDCVVPEAALLRRPIEETLLFDAGGA